MIYIGIPVRNERETIGPLLWRIREILYGEQREYHVLICDDASNDGTSETLSQYEHFLPMTFFHNDVRKGYAASLERLIKAALKRSTYPKRDALVTMQGDFSDSPERICEMMRRFEGGADLVTVGSVPNEPFARRFTRIAGQQLARGLHTTKLVDDPFASLRLYRLFVLARAIDESDSRGQVLNHEGWAANAELLLRVGKFLRRFEEIRAESIKTRRYRDSRYRAWRELYGLIRASRDPAIRKLVSNLNAMV